METSSNPSGMMLVNPYQTNRVGDPMDLVCLAQQVQKVSDALGQPCDIQFLSSFNDGFFFFFGWEF